jgi:peptidoglycan/xylan/chitin deacetylase (PgdA/CDA1 family)
MLDSAGVKATFYISSYHKLTPEQITKLKTIRDHGNEIGYHTTNHVHVPFYIEHNGVKAFMKNEIAPDLLKMRADGFNPVVFAYPYGDHNLRSDSCMLCHFKSVRNLNGTNNYAKSLTADSDETKLYAMVMDKNSNRSDQLYDQMLESAKQNNNCFILVGHRIEHGVNDMKVPLYRLRHLIAKAKELGLKFYTVSEISRK